MASDCHRVPARRQPPRSDEFLRLSVVVADARISGLRLDPLEPEQLLAVALSSVGRDFDRVSMNALRVANETVKVTAFFGLREFTQAGCALMTTLASFARRSYVRR
jgi:hypothetical protein